VTLGPKVLGPGLGPKVLGLGLGLKPKSLASALDSDYHHTTIYRIVYRVDVPIVDLPSNFKLILLFFTCTFNIYLQIMSLTTCLCII
jgi:hypothetical protein